MKRQGLSFIPRDPEQESISGFFLEKRGDPG
jgi:hypothetical protein